MSDEMEEFLVKCHNKGMTATEIAKCMRISQQTVRSKLSRLDLTPNVPQQEFHPDMEFFNSYGSSEFPEPERG